MPCELAHNATGPTSEPQNGLQGSKPRAQVRHVMQDACDEHGQALREAHSLEPQVCDRCTPRGQSGPAKRATASGCLGAQTARARRDPALRPRHTSTSLHLDVTFHRIAGVQQVLAGEQRTVLRAVLSLTEPSLEPRATRPRIGPGRQFPMQGPRLTTTDIDTRRTERHSIPGTGDTHGCEALKEKNMCNGVADIDLKNLYTLSDTSECISNESKVHIHNTATKISLLLLLLISPHKFIERRRERKR